MIPEMSNLHYGDSIVHEHLRAVRQEAERNRQLRSLKQNGSIKKEKGATPLFARLRAVWLLISTGINTITSHVTS